MPRQWIGAKTASLAAPALTLAAALVRRSRTKGGFVLLQMALLVLLSLLPAPSGAIEPGVLPGILGTDDRVPRDSVDWPWSAIGRLNRSTGGFCTGTLVGPRQVLTAAHCLYDRRKRPLSPDDIHFVAGYRRGAYLAHSVAHSVILPKDYRPDAALDPEMLTSDWAIVVLEDALPIRPISVRAAPPAGGIDHHRLSRAGYSQDRAHLLSVHEGCDITGSAEHGGLLLHDCDATRGDSGSPLLLRREGSVSVVGVDVGSARVDGVDRGLAVPTARFAATLRNTIDGD